MRQYGLHSLQVVRGICLAARRGGAEIKPATEGEDGAVWHHAQRPGMPLLPPGGEDDFINP